ncbi:MAG: flippase [Clostridia bacterium]|nr:flippase [Clostridia bacterium]
MRKRFSKNGLIILKNSAFGMSGAIFSQVIAMVTSIAMGRILGAEGVGIYSFALTIAAIMYIFLNLGLSGIFQRDVAQDKSLASKYYANTLFLRLCVAIPIGLLIFIALTFILGRADQIAIMLLSCLYIGFSGVYTIVIGGITAFENFKVHSLLSIIEKSCLLATTVVSLLLTKSIVVMLISYNVVFITLIVITLLYINKHFCKIYIEADIPFCKKYIREAAPQILSAAAEYMNLRSDLLVLSLLINDTATGIYSVSSNIYIAASVIPLAVAKAATPTFNRTLGENKNPKSIVKKTFLLMEGLSVALCVGVVCLARVGIMFLWGHEFEGSVFLLQILAISLLFMPLNRFFGYLLVGLKRQDVVAKCTWIGTVANLTGNFALVPVLGISAVAYTTIATEFLVTLVEFIVLRKNTDYFK